MRKRMLFAMVIFLLVMGVYLATHTPFISENNEDIIISSQGDNSGKELGSLIKPKPSETWDLTGTPILIVGNGGWFSVNNTYEWCNGKGTLIKPYVLENITIDGQNTGNCIEIKDSDVYFIIKDCTLYNSNPSAVGSALILLNNVSNGQILGNDLSDGNRGVYLRGFVAPCEWNLISGNTIFDCHNDAVFVSDSDNNFIGNNDISAKGKDGITVRDGNDNVVDNNEIRITLSIEYGIMLWKGDNTATNNKLYTCRMYVYDADGSEISANTIYNCFIQISGTDHATIESNTVLSNIYYDGDGMRLINCHYNSISYNDINYHDRYGLYLVDCTNNDVIENELIGNADGCIIKESCSDNYFEGNICEEGSSESDDDDDGGGSGTSVIQGTPIPLLYILIAAGIIASASVLIYKKLRNPKP